MSELFDMKLRARRRDRAARTGVELFLLDRIFRDCLERVELLDRRFSRALMIGCPDAAWAGRLGSKTDLVAVRDPGPLFAAAAGGETITEDDWKPADETYDLVLSVGTLDTVNHLPAALRLIRYAMAPDSLLIGAVSGGDTLPRLRAAMRAADAIAGAAAAHVHPRIEPSALSPLLADAGFVRPVVDVERIQVSYPSLGGLVADLRAMAATSILNLRPPPLMRPEREAAFRTFAEAGDGQRTTETFEILHFAGWTPKPDDAALTV